MFLSCKNTIKFIPVLLLILVVYQVNAQTPQNRTPKPPFTKNLTGADSGKNSQRPPLAGGDTAIGPRTDSLVNTTDTFSVNYSKDSLDAPVKREALDSAVFLVKEKKFILYGKAQAEYRDSKVNAAVIELDNERNLMRARARLDSTGAVDEQVKMLSGGQEVMADSLVFNIKNKKGVSYNSRTKTDDIYVTSARIKMVGDGKTYFGYRNLFTTCNLDTPHFAFFAKRIKVINQELAVSGFARPEFEGVPVPVGIPFGIYPMKKGRHSGFIPPEFTANEDLGIGLTGGGYYKVINDYWDLMLQTNLYSYGSWNLIVTPSYRKRYKYQGRFTINIQNTKLNFKGDADFSKNRSFNIGWNHTADTRARPGINFSANINAGKTSFNQFNPNNPFGSFNNQLYSSITWSKNWADLGKPFNLTISANHNQNANLNLVNLNLPDINFSVQTQYPFQRKNADGPQKWYEKIGISYNGNFRSQMAFKDTEPIREILRTLVDTFQWGASHNIPITLSLPALGALQVNPSVTYEERTYGTKMYQVWNNAERRVDTTIRKGIYEARQMSFGLSFATALFGTFNFKKHKTGLIAMRHVIRPQFGIQYTPNFNRRNYYELQVDTTPANGSKPRTVRTSYFTGNLYSPFSEIEYGGINFGIDNNLELKTRSRTDTTKNGEKKVKLIDGFGFSSGYNFLEDSMQLQAFSLYLRSSLADGKVNITGTATIDPYQVNSKGDRIAKYTWDGQKFGLGSFGRFTNAGIALSSQFRGGEKQNKKAAKEKLEGAGQSLEDLTPDEQMRMMEYIRTHPAEFADFNVPWNLGVQMAINITRILQPDYSYKTEFFVNANFNGDFNLTPRWKVGANGFYDFKTKKVQSLQMFISREMHCWQLSINVVPVGYYRSFNITLNPKAGILRDLRINRTRFFYSN